LHRIMLDVWDEMDWEKMKTKIVIKCA